MKNSALLSEREAPVFDTFGITSSDICPFCGFPEWKAEYDCQESSSFTKKLDGSGNELPSPTGMYSHCRFFSLHLWQGPRGMVSGVLHLILRFLQNEQAIRALLRGLVEIESIAEEWWVEMGVTGDES